MKKLIIILILLISPLISYSQDVYAIASIDVRNAVVGSAPTLNKPAADILITLGARGNKGFTVEVGYEHFQEIEFQKMFFAMGYTFISDSKKLELAITLDPTYITRDWKSENYVGKQNYRALGQSTRLTYNFNETYGISAIGNALRRTDLAERYHHKTEIVYSLYVGVTYTFTIKQTLRGGAY